MSFNTNLYKSSWVVMHEQGTRVIDNNALLEEKLSKARKAAFMEKKEPREQEEGFVEGLDAEKLDALFAQNGASIQEMNRQKEELSAQIEQAKSELEEIRSQAESIMEDARTQAETIKTKAYEEARNQGYREGHQAGMQEAEAVREEYLSMKRQNEQEYQQQLENLEPEFVENLTGIYEHIFKVDLSRYRELVANLLAGAMQKIEEARNFLVHVSKEDYEGVIASREYIRSEAGAGVTVEIVEDVTLSRSQCFIETENGIYDCSLDTQLSELGRKLRLLSYEKT